jgi:hypothetical protein
MRIRGDSVPKSYARWLCSAGGAETSGKPVVGQSSASVSALAIWHEVTAAQVQIGDYAARWGTESCPVIIFADVAYLVMRRSAVIGS